jgi:hypothetical protein
LLELLHPKVCRRGISALVGPTLSTVCQRL